MIDDVYLLKLKAALFMTGLQGALYVQCVGLPDMHSLWVHISNFRYRDVWLIRKHTMNAMGRPSSVSVL